TATTEIYTLSLHEALPICLPRRAEAGELTHGPQPAAVHRGMDAASERILAGIAEVRVGIEVVEAFRRVERRDGHAADGGWRLLARWGGGDFLLPAVAGGGVSDSGHR